MKKKLHFLIEQKKNIDILLYRLKCRNIVQRLEIKKHFAKKLSFFQNCNYEKKIRNSNTERPKIFRIPDSAQRFFLVIKLKNKTEKSDKMPKSGTHVYNSKTYPADCWKIGMKQGLVSIPISIRDDN